MFTVYPRFFLTLGVGATLCLSGCMATQEALDQVRAFNTTTRDLVNRTRSQLSMTQGLTQVQLDNANEALGALDTAVISSAATIDEIETRIQPLLDASDLPSAIQGIGAIAAPFLGPYGGLALLLTNGLAVALTRRRTRTTTANHIIAPMEAARDRDLEYSITDPPNLYTVKGDTKERLLERIKDFNDDRSRNAAKGDFIVLNKTVLAPAHAANGAAALIKKATS